METNHSGPDIPDDARFSASVNGVNNILEWLRVLPEIQTTPLNRSQCSLEIRDQQVQLKLEISSSAGRTFALVFPPIPAEPVRPASRRPLLCFMTATKAVFFMVFSPMISVTPHLATYAVLYHFRSYTGSDSAGTGNPAKSAGQAYLCIIQAITWTDVGSKLAFPRKHPACMSSL